MAGGRNADVEFAARWAEKSVAREAGGKSGGLSRRTLKNIGARGEGLPSPVVGGSAGGAAAGSGGVDSAIPTDAGSIGGSGSDGGVS